MDTREFEERIKTIDLSIEAEGRIASAFYLVDPMVELVKARIGAWRRRPSKGMVGLGRS